MESEAMTRKVNVGDKVIFYVTRTQPPAFMGVYEISKEWRKANEPVWSDEKEAGEIIYTFRTDIKQVKIGTAHVKEIVKNLEFIINKRNYQVYLIGSPGNMKRPIPEKDLHTIMGALREESAFIEPRPSEPKPTTPQVPISLRHHEIRDLIMEIGNLKSFIAETEHPMDGLRIDTVWKTVAQAAPNWVFEVQIGGDLYEALTKLKHAYDIWNSRHLYLVTVEDYVDQAEWLLSGAFHQIHHDTRVVHWRKFAELYELLSRVSALEKELGLESRS
jgi:predicted RNA-binding protein